MIFKFSKLDEVIEQVNNTKYGLASGIITSKMDQAFAYVNSVKAGSVWYLKLKSKYNSRH